jgi:FtsP/CotA-like multicopper oxidase with cupredoxin domain
VLTLALLASLTFGVQPQLVAALPRVPLPQPSPTAVRATVHGNRLASGALRGRTLTLALDVVESAWHPESTDEPEVPIFAFAERGRGPVVPGPMIRVPQGTEVRLTLRNLLDSALVLGGFRPGLGESADTVHLAPRATRELRYKLDVPGSYFYWGAFKGTTLDDRLWLDSQLNGAIIVDAPGARTDDHVLLMSEWFHPYPGTLRPFEVVAVINGKGWPNTERITLQQGDSTRFRVLNTLAIHHPMHLHGFYYRVESEGSWGKDGPIAAERQSLFNTRLLPPGGTLTLAFAATTPGNWVFHCHFSFHMDESSSLAGSPRDTAHHAASHGPNEASNGHRMAGLVIGLHVNPNADHRAPSMEGARDMRLLVQRKPGALITRAPAYGFVLQRAGSAPKRDSVELPGPVLELERGKPVRIHVINNLDEPTGIHWHGLEIESFPDGVPDWSGMGGHIFAPIAPRDSFVAEFTPPRSGTFPYHSHLNERHQINSGMYGAVIVSDAPRDTTRDHVIVAGGGGPELLRKIKSPFALVNGRRSPRPLRLTAGQTHRLRIVSIHPDWRIGFTLRNDSTVARWRAIAKDGADLPPVLATDRAAHVEMGPGETADFEFTPTAAGEWRIEVNSVETGWHIPLPVIVTARPR